MDIIIEEYDVLYPIGEGTYGEVYLVRPYNKFNRKKDNQNNNNNNDSSLSNKKKHRPNTRSYNLKIKEPIDSSSSFSSSSSSSDSSPLFALKRCKLSLSENTLDYASIAEIIATTTLHHPHLIHCHRIVLTKTDIFFLLDYYPTSLEYIEGVVGEVLFSQSKSTPKSKSESESTSNHEQNNSNEMNGDIIMITEKEEEKNIEKDTENKKKEEQKNNGREEEDKKKKGEGKEEEEEKQTEEEGKEKIGEKIVNEKTANQKNYLNEILPDAPIKCWPKRIRFETTKTNQTVISHSSYSKQINESQTTILSDSNYKIATYSSPNDLEKLVEKRINMIQQYKSQLRKWLWEVIGYENEIEKNKFVLKVFAQIVQALAYLERKGWYHSDVKSSNFLIDIPDWSQPNFSIRLIDFGLMKRTHRHFDPESYPAQMCCPSEYYDKSFPLYGHAIDVWGLGCVLGGILTGCDFLIKLNPTRDPMSTLIECLFQEIEEEDSEDIEDEEEEHSEKIKEENNKDQQNSKEKTVINEISTTTICFDEDLFSDMPSLEVDPDLIVKQFNSNDSSKNDQFPLDSKDKEGDFELEPENQKINGNRVTGWIKSFTHDLTNIHYDMLQYRGLRDYTDVPLPFRRKISSSSSSLPNSSSSSTSLPSPSSYLKNLTPEFRFLFSQIFQSNPTLRPSFLQMWNIVYPGDLPCPELLPSDYVKSFQEKNTRLTKTKRKMESEKYKNNLVEDKLLFLTCYRDQIQKELLAFKLDRRNQVEAEFHTSILNWNAVLLDTRRFWQELSTHQRNEIFIMTWLLQEHSLYKGISRHQGMIPTNIEKITCLISSFALAMRTVDSSDIIPVQISSTILGQYMRKIVCWLDGNIDACNPYAYIRLCVAQMFQNHTNVSEICQERIIGVAGKFLLVALILKQWKQNEINILEIIQMCLEMAIECIDCNHFFPNKEFKEVCLTWIKENTIKPSRYFRRWGVQKKNNIHLELLELLDNCFLNHSFPIEEENEREFDWLIQFDHEELDAIEIYLMK